MLLQLAAAVLVATLVSAHGQQHVSTDAPPTADARPPPAAATGIAWTDASSFLQNSGWNSSVPRSTYARLPLAAETGDWCTPLCPARPDVWSEGQNGPGLYLAFETDAAEVYLNATLLEPASEGVNCGAACSTGVDMYAFDTINDAWRWVATAWPGPGGWAWSGTTIYKAMVSDPVLPSVTPPPHSPGATHARRHVGARGCTEELPDAVVLSGAAWADPLPDPPPDLQRIQGRGDRGDSGCGRWQRPDPQGGPPARGSTGADSVLRHLDCQRPRRQPARDDLHQRAVSGSRPRCGQPWLWRRGHH